MGQPAPTFSASPRLVLAWVALGLGACAAQSPVPATLVELPDVEPVTLPATLRYRLPSLRPVATGTVQPRPEPVRLPGIAVVVSGHQSAYTSVADELQRRVGRVTVYELAEDDLSTAAAFRRIGDSDTGAIVAIGAAAARAAVDLATVPVVFCQVFNYADAGLVTDSSRGVAVLAPLDLHLDAWQRASPRLRRIGMILGPGHESLVEEAEIAAATHRLALDLRIVDSDQEAQYQFRRMVNDIDGFWLFPDNRVLSMRTLREILAHAGRRKVEVAVSNDALLALGATISLSAVPEDIATTVVRVLRRIESGELPQVPDLTPLSALQVATR